MALKKNEIAKYKQRLTEMREHLTKQYRELSSEVKKPDEATGYSQHQADQGTDDFDHSIGLELTSREYTMLKQIDRALQKIDEDTYGMCDISGKEIPKARLEIMPYATMTVEEQEKIERGEG